MGQVSMKFGRTAAILIAVKDFPLASRVACATKRAPAMPVAGGS
jgi:hypothetical protein